MKSSITIPCACGSQIPLEITGSTLPKDANCAECGATIWLVEPLGNVVALLLITRAKQELAHNDVTISTHLSATAVESEMAYLFFKWKGLDSGKFLGNQTPEDRNAWEDEWASMRSIGKRLDELSRFLTSKPFDEFAHSKMNLLTTSLTSYDPATSIKGFIQENLFDQRNDIVHYGKIDLQEPDGTRCLSLASALLTLFDPMDMTRVKAMEEAFRRARCVVPQPGSP